MASVRRAERVGWVLLLQLTAAIFSLLWGFYPSQPPNDAGCKWKSEVPRLALVGGVFPREMGLCEPSKISRLSAWGWVGIIPDRGEELMESSSEEKDWGETALDGVWAAWAGGGHPAHSRGGAEGALGSPTQLRCDSVAL